MSFGKLISPVGNDFVDVHVALGAASGLPDRKGKVAVETASRISFAGLFQCSTAFSLGSVPSSQFAWAADF